MRVDVGHALCISEQENLAARVCLAAESGIALSEPYPLPYSRTVIGLVGIEAEDFP